MKSIAIDGPSGAGKSTLARQIADRLGFTYVDTGAIYRSVGLYVRRAGVSPDDAQAVAALLPAIRLELQYDAQGVQHVLLCGEDVSDAIRTPEISMYASVVSALPSVRAFLLDMQRELARRHDVVMDGRDIGTVVLPEATVKIFLTASIEERARRRWLELQARGMDCSYQEVLQDMQRRDANDSGRTIAPLCPAADSLLLDTTSLDLEESLRAAMRLIEERV